MDNIFIERLWRSLKYEAVYLHEMTDGFAAGQGADLLETRGWDDRASGVIEV